jgi:hypothetical protein
MRVKSKSNMVKNHNFLKKKNKEKGKEEEEEEALKLRKYKF